MMFRIKRLAICGIIVARWENKYVRFGACYLRVHSWHCYRFWRIVVFMIFTVLLFSILVALVSASALCEFSHDVRDVICFLVMLVIGVVVVLVLVVKGF